MDNLMSTDAHAKLMADLKAHQEKQNDQTTRELPARTHYRCQNCDTLNRIGRVCICLAQPKNLK